MLQKTFQCEVKEVEVKDGRTHAIIAVSGPEMDRDGEFVHPEGGKTAPGIPFLYGHNWSGLRANLGVVAKGEFSGGQYLNHIIVDDNIPEHQDAVIAAKKLKNGSLGTYSIGFEPHLVKKADGRMVKVSRGDWISSEQGQHILEWSQLELSAVAVPSYPDTGVLQVRSLEGAEGKALRALIREALDSILGSDEFAARLRTIQSPKPDEGKSGDPAREDLSAATAAATAPPAPSGLALDLDQLLHADPMTLAMHTDQPEALVRALAAASGDGALDDLDSFFTEAAPPAAGATGA